MDQVTIDITRAESFVDPALFSSVKKEVIEKRRILLNRTGKGSDFLGWIDLPARVPEDLLNKIEADAGRIRQHSKIVVVVGIGGSYLGARAVIDALSHPFQHLLKNPGNPLVVYAGENLSEDYHAGLIEILDATDYSALVISKSGTTTEPAVAFRLLKAHLEKKYGTEGAKHRILSVTDASKGALKKMSDEKGYPTYVIPDDVGGRYSVLTPVGLLPVAIAGFDIRKLLRGAVQMRADCLDEDKVADHPSVVYAAMRNALYRSGKSVEIMVNYQPDLFYFTEWWKQLYGESEGKEQKGILPAGVSFTTDLHSMGQYIQEGARIMFETVLSVANTKKELRVPFAEGDPDGLNFVAEQRLSSINKMAELGTMLAHVDGGVPNIHIGIPGVSEEILGQLIFFYEFACGLSGYTLDVNPFDQPGVEAYKKNMFALLGKPGFEKEGEELKARL
ncbi:MAG: glucose-6-phosphate isomerase [Syntrophothermus sp.]